MKPGDGVIWILSSGRLFLSRWRVQQVDGVIVHVCRQRIKIRVQLAWSERIVILDPKDVPRAEEEEDKAVLPPDGRAA